MFKSGETVWPFVFPGPLRKSPTSAKTLPSTFHFATVSSLSCRSLSLHPRSKILSSSLLREIAIEKQKPVDRLATKSGKRSYAPDRGDLVWLTFDPQAGHEQAGRRPAVVLSPAGYNRKAGLAVFAPITGRIKGYPFEVLIPPGLGVAGAILADQLKSLDWRARKATRIGSLPLTVIHEVLQKASLLVSPAG